MKISTRGRYAIRALVNIAKQEGKLTSIKTISSEEEISVKYMEKIISQLVKGNLISSIRGSNGGYVLNKDPNDYTLKEILEISEGSIAPVKCLEDEVNQCPHYDKCSTISLWETIYEKRNELFSNITLADIVNKEYKL